MVPQELLDRRRAFASFLRRRLSNAADAEDILQQAFLSAARAAPSPGEPGLAVSWFYAVLRNAIAEHHRRTGRQARLATEACEDAPPSSMPPHEIGTCSCSVALLPELPTIYQDILQRVDVREDSLDAVALELGLTLNNATVRLHRARKALRERIVACCGCRSSKECLNCRCATGCQ